MWFDHQQGAPLSSPPVTGRRPSQSLASLPGQGHFAVILS